MKQKNHSFKLIMTIVIVIVSLLAVPIGSFMGFELPVLFETKVSAETYGYYTYTVSNGEATITDCNTSIRGNVVIPDTLGGYPVTRIDSYAFYNCTGLTSISIPDSITSMGSSAFNGCTGLKRVYITDLAAWCNISFGSSYANPLYYAKKLYINGDLATNITIPDGVKSIGSYAFEGCNSLTSVTIGNSVASIGICAFEGCNSLTSVTIGNSVTSIGYEAFYGCTGLTSITIPDSVISIDEYAFSGCTGLTSVTIGNSVASIGICAFEGCNSLTSVTIGNSVTSIGEYAFYNCTGLTSVTIGNSVTSIGRSAFEGTAWYNAQPDGDIYIENIYYKYKGTMPANTSIVIKEGTKGIVGSAFSGCTGLTSVTIGNSITNIGYDAFYGCTGLTSVTIGNSVTSIGNSAFRGCTGLTSITIPDSVTNIGSYAFEDCTGLTSVTIGNSVTSIGGAAFGGCTGLTKINWNAESVCDFDFSNVFYNAGKSGDGIDFIFGDNVKIIPAYAFYYCTDLTSVTIGNSVTSIGEYAFYNCTGLTKINWNAENVSDFTYNSEVFTNAGTAGDGIDVVFGDNVRRIPAYAFDVFDSSDRPKIKSVTIGNNVTSIGYDAFYGCTGLTSVTIPDSVTSIGASAFYGCTGLTSVYITDLAAWCNISFGSSSANPLCYAKKLYINGELATNITIPDGVKSIGVFAFYGCNSLTSVTIPDGVTSIGASAFYGCTGLTQINWNAENVSDFSAESNVFYNAGTAGDGIDVIFGDSVKRIPNYVFYASNSSYRPKLKSVNIGNSVTRIGSYAFGNCTGLTSVIIPDSVTSIGSNVFYNCPLEYVKMGNGLNYIPEDLIKNTLREFVIGNSVTSITESAFFGCTGLTSVTIPNSVTSIGGFAFSDCTGLTSVYITDLAAWCNISFGSSSANPLCYAKKLYINGKIATNITIPDSVERIGSYAFSGYTGLTSITIPDSVTSIGSYAFRSCTGLTKINWNAESVSDFSSECNVFFNAGTAGDGIDVVFGDSVKRIPNYVFSVSNSSYRPKLKSVSIGNSVTSIGDCAFYDCTDLTKINWNAESVSDFTDDSDVFFNTGTSGDGIDVVFGDSVKRIPAYTFYVDRSSFRPNIKFVTIGNSVTNIGRYAFEGTAWYNAQPDGDIYIGNIYYKYKGIMPANTSIVIKEGTKGISSFAFSGRTGLTSVTIPDSVASIGSYAFYNCTGLTSVTIPDSVASIGSYGFYNCTGLTSVTIPDSVTSIDDYIFDRCSGLETVKFTGKPPRFSSKTFYGYNKTVLYPYGISEWKSAIKSKYGGSFTWVCYSTGSLTTLKVNSLPKKTVYYQGETAIYSGLKLTATWSDGFSTVITPDSKIYNISLSGFSTETPGLKTVTATLDGKSAQFKIGVHKTTTFTEDQSKYPESDHNYADNLNQTKTYKCPDAIKLIVTFSDKTFVEKDGDYIYVNGTKYTGDQLAGKTITVSGNTLTVKLVSDSYGNYYGYSIDKIEVTKIEHTNETTTTKATTSADGKIVTACTICGKISKTVVIPKIASISLSSTSYTYDGKVKTPSVTVKDSKGKTLKNGTDYTVSYASGRKTPGQYAVKITFKGNYSGSKTLYFTILPGVTSKIATATNSSAIKIAWKAVPGATGYRVYQYDTKTKKYVTLKTTTGTSYTVTKLKSGTSYKFAVRAYTIVNGKVYWASGYKTITAATNPGTPTLKVTAGTKKAALSWTKQTGATGYVVYMATSQNGKYSKIATLKGNSKVSYTKTGLTKGKTYYFKVAAYTVANGKTLYSGYSSVKAVKIK